MVLLNWVLSEFASDQILLPECSAEDVFVGSFPLVMIEVYSENTSANALLMAPSDFGHGTR